MLGLYTGVPLPEREAHLAAFRRIRAEEPDVVIPGHYAPITIR